MDEDPPPSTQALISTQPGSTANPARKSDGTGDAFELSQLLFVVGHIAIKLSSIWSWSSANGNGKNRKRS
jgi:hypothetical protein